MTTTDAGSRTTTHAGTPTTTRATSRTTTRADSRSTADARDRTATNVRSRPATDAATRALSDVEGLFGPESVTWRVHGDPSMLLAGFRALLLQAVHPLAMAGFNANSNYRADPWGRLQRTGTWVATVSYGTRTEAEAAGAALRALHARLRPGVEPETGLSYRVDDPELLLWVHCAEVDSFLSTYRRSGAPLAPGDGDRYIDEMRESARLVGLDPASVPSDEAELRDYFDKIRPTLYVTSVARRNALWGFAPPMPWWVQLATPARPSWALLVGTAAALLPRWARRLYGLPGLPTTDLTAEVTARAVRQTLLRMPGSWAASPAKGQALRRLAQTSSTSTGSADAV